jgi:hypothetical protein
MTLRTLRLLTVAVALLALVLPAAGTAATADVTIDRGVVQSVGSGQIVLRALDGNVASLTVSPTTRVRLNGVRVPLSEIRPGFVAAVTHDGTAPALLIRAFGKRASVTDRGVVTALTRSGITLQTAGGATVTVSLDTSTRFRFHGLPGGRFLARPGALVAVRHPVDGPAKVVNVLKRARA